MNVVMYKYFIDVCEQRLQRQQNLLQKKEPNTGRKNIKTKKKVLFSKIWKTKFNITDS